ncbi:hypothetical protein J4470_04820 [Candidatus Woesearchaeota archaeon]|nr:hypothetical protein [Candidatus Woesearchaeota archaeon]
MADASTFRGTLDFLGELGVFDVVLPFLLVFTIVFALLEKTRVFGTDKVGDTEYSKKPLNSLASFVIAFFVIASSRLVEIITQISANVVVLILASTFFLLLAGSFHEQKPGGFFLEQGRFRTLFMTLMFFGLAFIFLNAIKTKDKTWLSWIFDWLRQFTDNVSVATVVLVAIVIAFMYYIGAIGGSAEVKENSKSGK